MCKEKVRIFCSLSSLSKTYSLNICLYFQVAQTRLEKRTHRKNVELCRDIPQYQLCHEVAEIDGSLKALSEKHQVAEIALQSLLQDLARISEDLGIKTKSLALDEQCTKLRENLKSPELISNVAVTAPNQENDSLPAKINDMSISSDKARLRGSPDLHAVTQLNSNDSDYLHSGVNTANNSLLQSTYNVDFDDMRNKRSGDLERTVGERRSTTRVVDFA